MATEAVPPPASGDNAVGTTDTLLAALPLERWQLQNGLRVVLSADHLVPTVAVAIYYDVGSRNEAPGRSGFAHLFEHMMFEGSANVERAQHVALIVGRGGSLNGTTSHDRTSYYALLPSRELALALWLEADRLRSLKITQANFERQRRVVLEERRRSYDSQPYAHSTLRINELAFEGYWPYQHSTIGEIEDLEAASLAAVQAFFDKHYAPNNAVLSIAGDFDPAAAMKLVQRYFGALPPKPVARFEEPPAPAQAEPRSARMTDPHVRRHAFHIAYRIPRLRSPDHYALRLLAAVLGGGPTSRLQRALVGRGRLLAELRAVTDDRRGPDLFSFWAVCAKGQTCQEAQKQIEAELKRIQKRGVTLRELQRAKHQVRAKLVYGLESNLARAQRLAEYELYWGDARLLRKEPERYLAVTLKDLRQVARRYLKPENRTLLDVLPEQPGPVAAPGPTPGTSRAWTPETRARAAVSALRRRDARRSGGEP